MLKLKGVDKATDLFDWIPGPDTKHMWFYNAPNRTTLINRAKTQLGDIVARESQWFSSGITYPTNGDVPYGRSDGAYAFLQFIEGKDPLPVSIDLWMYGLAPANMPANACCLWRAWLTSLDNVNYCLLAHAQKLSGVTAPGPDNGIYSNQADPRILNVSKFMGATNVYEYHKVTCYLKPAIQRYGLTSFMIKFISKATDDNGKSQTHSLRLRELYINY